jgi:hypothetical protein
MLTIRELIEQLEEAAQEHGDDIEVRLAQQPRWAFEYSIGGVAVADPESDGDDEEDEQPEDPSEPAEVVCYIGEGSQIGYLSGCAARALGWKE